jgi:hypothetical protein
MVSAISFRVQSGDLFAVSMAQPLQASITPMPPKIMMAKVHSTRTVMIFCFIGFFRLSE